ncbi:adenylate kinase 8 [Anolis carolinensis]|uniref:adenylate kinase 8 n=1 Tax=Anolis carolinensis TaxID=28377 RepID=UPI000203B31E|nr:PREDICTED: adenylate kinase 8 [Anolis carolinensis]|eukprot:XP_003229468.1 PREDICTED: adenylate kinase 8 [Anolis carolinensis]
MDATSRPHRIPPAMGVYAEKHKVFQMMQNMTEALLIYRPKDPIEFMIEHLMKDNDEVPAVLVLGPPAAGKTTIARWLCKHLSATYLSPQQLLRNKLLRQSREALARQQLQGSVPDELWAGLLEERLADVDCVKLGWVLDGFPETRAQARLLQALGVAPRHVVVLEAPEMVLVERNLGKRVDPLTQEVYHTTFDWPIDFTVQKRLVKPEGTSVQDTAKRLLESHRNIPGLLRTYPDNHKVISADQPCADVFAQALSFVQSRFRSEAPFLPRVLLLGPPGSGKSLQAALLAQKYGLVPVSFVDLLREEVVGRTSLGELIRPSFESGYPVGDTVALRVLGNRLSQLDCATRGWVLHGFPRDVDQAELLRRAGLEPNRVFFLHLPTEVTTQRLCQRATDPISGERYHTIFKPPANEEILQRLRRNPHDAPPRVEKKADAYGRQVADLEDFYEEALFVNADQDPYTVFEHLESCLVTPLPVTRPGTRSLAGGASHL